MCKINRYIAIFTALLLSAQIVAMIAPPILVLTIADDGSLTFFEQLHATSEIYFSEVANITGGSESEVLSLWWFSILACLIMFIFSVATVFRPNTLYLKFVISLTLIMVAEYIASIILGFSFIFILEGAILLLILISSVLYARYFSKTANENCA